MIARAMFRGGSRDSEIVENYNAAIVHFGSVLSDDGTRRTERYDRRVIEPYVTANGAVIEVEMVFAGSRSDNTTLRQVVNQFTNALVERIETNSELPTLRTLQYQMSAIVGDLDRLEALVRRIAARTSNAQGTS